MISLNSNLPGVGDYVARAILCLAYGKIGMDIQPENNKNGGCTVLYPWPSSGIPKTISGYSPILKSDDEVKAIKNSGEPVSQSGFSQISQSDGEPIIV